MIGPKACFCEVAPKIGPGVGTKQTGAGARFLMTNDEAGNSVTGSPGTLWVRLLINGSSPLHMGGRGDEWLQPGSLKAGESAAIEAAQLGEEESWRVRWNSMYQ